MRKKYSKFILETIQAAKENRHWLISDYTKLLKDFYGTLDKKNTKEFNSSVVKLLYGKRYIENLVDICRELEIKDSCSALLRLFKKIPEDLEENGRSVWAEGLQRNIVYTLGLLKCYRAVPSLKQFIDNMRHQKKVNFTADSCGVVIHALTNISSDESSKYFGWWVNIIQEIENNQFSFVKSLDDWKKMKIDKAVLFDSAVNGFSSVKNCIVSVAQNKGLAGLKKWLGAVTLYDEKDRFFLQQQIKILADGANDLFPNLKRLCNYSGKSNKLSLELSSLPKKYG